MAAVNLSLCERLGHYVTSQDFSSAVVKAALPAITAAGACAAVLVSSQALMTVPLVAVGVAAISFLDVYFHGNGKGGASLHFLALRVMAAVAIVGGLAVGCGLGIAAAGLLVPFGGAAITSQAFWTIVLIKTAMVSFAAGFPLALGYRTLQAYGQVSERFDQFKNMISLIRAQVGNESSFFTSIETYFSSLAKIRDDLKMWQRPDIALISRSLHSNSTLSASAKSAIVAQAFPSLTDPEKEYFLTRLGNDFDAAVFEAILPPAQALRAVDWRYLNPFHQEGTEQDLQTLNGAAAAFQNLEPQRLQLEALRVQIQGLQAHSPVNIGQAAERTRLEGVIRNHQFQIQQLRNQPETPARVAQIQQLRDEIAAQKAQIDLLRQQIAAQQEAVQEHEQQIADLEAQAALLQGQLFPEVEPILRAHQRMTFRMKSFILLGRAFNSAIRSPAVQEKIGLYNEYAAQVNGINAHLQQMLPALRQMRAAAEPRDENAEALELASTSAILLEKGLRDRDAERIGIRTGRGMGDTFQHLAERFASLGVTSRGDLIALGIVPAAGGEEMSVDEIVDRIVAFLSSPAHPLPPAVDPGRLAQPLAGPQSAAIAKVRQVALFVLHYVISPLFVVYQVICSPIAICVGFILGLTPFADFVGYFMRQYVVFPDYTRSSVDGAIRQIFVQAVFALIGGIEEEGFGVLTGVALGMRAKAEAAALYNRVSAWIDS